jgi:hypothetical protein
MVMWLEGKVDRRRKSGKCSSYCTCDREVLAWSGALKQGALKVLVSFLTLTML